MFISPGRVVLLHKYSPTPTLITLCLSTVFSCRAAALGLHFCPTVTVSPTLSASSPIFLLHTVYPLWGHTVHTSSLLWQHPATWCPERRSWSNFPRCWSSLSKSYFIKDRKNKHSSQRPNYVTPLTKRQVISDNIKSSWKRSAKKKRQEIFLLYLLINVANQQWGHASLKFYIHSYQKICKDQRAGFNGI